MTSLLIAPALSYAMVAEWELAFTLTYYPAYTHQVRLDENWTPEEIEIPGYEGQVEEQQECAGSTRELSWSPRVSHLYGPNAVVVSWSHMPNFTVGAMKARLHTVHWRGDFYGELWVKEGATPPPLTGDPQIDSQILRDAYLSEIFAARIDQIWRGHQRVREFDLTQSPEPGTGRQPD